MEDIITSQKLNLKLQGKLSKYIVQLRERFDEITTRIIDEVAFYKQNPNYIKLLDLAKSNSKQVRTDCRQFQNFPNSAFYDNRFPSYNVNQYDFGAFICEGPEPGSIDAVSRYIENVFFNNDCDIQYVLILGQPDEGERFHNYFAQNGVYENYLIESISASNPSDTIKKYSLRITDQGNYISKNITAVHIANMPDHHIATLTANDIVYLYDLFSSIKPEQLIAHCAAGLGRSPTFLFAFYLFKNFKENFIGDNNCIVNAIIKSLASFRRVRPSSIQQSKQLKQAIGIAIDLFSYYLRVNPALELEYASAIKAVALVGCFDTKADDYDFLRKNLLKNGISVFTIDIGIYQPTCTFPIDITNHTIFDLQNNVKDRQLLTKIRKENNRPLAIAYMKKALIALANDLMKLNLFDGLLGAGGTNGTELISAMMQVFPRHISKVLVTTIAQHENWSYTKTSGIILINSIVDVSGINRISETIYIQAIGTICGQLQIEKKPQYMQQEIDSAPKATKAVAISMFGNTTQCVEKCKNLLAADGYDVYVFHAVGTGGKALETLANEQEVTAILDITTTEIADEIGNGVFSAGPERLDASGKHCIPHLIVPGCLDMINLDNYDKAVRQYPDRTLLKCNENVTVMRTTVQENLQIGKFIANKVNKAARNGSPVTIVFSLKSLSMFDSSSLATGGITSWHDKYANKALFAAIEASIDNPKIPIIMVDKHINDEAFAKLIINVFIKLIAGDKIESYIAADTSFAALKNLQEKRINNKRKIPNVQDQEIDNQKQSNSQNESIYPDTVNRRTIGRQRSSSV